MSMPSMEMKMASRRNKVWGYVIAGISCSILTIIIKNDIVNTG
jgi:hypothetical protein